MSIYYIVQILVIWIGDLYLLFLRYSVLKLDKQVNHIKLEFRVKPQIHNLKLPEVIFTFQVTYSSFDILDTHTHRMGQEHIFILRLRAPSLGVPTRAPVFDVSTYNPHF